MSSSKDLVTVGSIHTHRQDIWSKYLARLGERRDDFGEIGGCCERIKWTHLQHSTQDYNLRTV